MNFEEMLCDVLSHSVPVILCVLGGNFAHRANALNITLEDMLLMGAFTSVLFVTLTKNIFLGILSSITVSLLLGLVFNFVSVTKRGNLIIAGPTIDLIASSVSAFILRAVDLPNLNVNNIMGVTALKIHIPIIQNIPFLGKVPDDHPFLTYLSFLGIFIMWVTVCRTKFGMYVHIVGENEGATVSVEIRTNRIKYAAILIGAVCYTLVEINMTLEKMALFANNMSTGIGFITTTAIFYGKGQPVRISLCVMLFGLMQALAINLNISAGPASGLLSTLPYFMIIMILAVISAMQLRDNHVRGSKAEWSPQPVKKVKLGVEQYGENHDSDRGYDI